MKVGNPPALSPETRGWGCRVSHLGSDPPRETCDDQGGSHDPAPMKQPCARVVCVVIRKVALWFSLLWDRFVSSVNY